MEISKVHDLLFAHLHDENLFEKPLFPLHTIQSMAERWGVSKQTVNNWAERHTDFPKEIEGIIEQTGRTPKVYPLYKVEKYEKSRGLNVKRTN